MDFDWVTIALGDIAWVSLAFALDYLIRTVLWAQNSLAMMLGIGVGLALSPSGGALVKETIGNIIVAWLALSGRLFLALIQLEDLAVPWDGGSCPDCPILAEIHGIES